MANQPDKPEKEYSFPFKECPCCGGDKFIGKELYAEEVKAGRIGEDMLHGLWVMTSMLIDPRKSALTAPVIVAPFDICANCGMFIPIKVTIYRRPTTNTGIQMPHPKVPPGLFGG